MRNTTGKRGPFECLAVLGESTVEGGGWLAKTEERYADVVHRLIETAQEQPLRYVNAGVGASVIAPRSPGYDASAKPSAAERLDEAVIAHKPDLVVIAYGLNDMRCANPIPSFRGELEDLIRRIREGLAPASPLIVLVNVYYMPAFQYYPPFDQGSPAATRAYNDMIREVADANDCVYADVFSAEGGCDYVVHPDTVHANKIGNMLIAHKVFEAIVHASPGIAKNVRARDAKTDWARECKKTEQSAAEPVRED